MRCVTYPDEGTALHVVVAPPLTGLAQLSVPFAPALAVTVYWCGAEQLAVVPPLLPLQLQAKKRSSALETAVAVPAPHRLLLGATKLATPFALPHAPLTGTTTATKVALTVQSAATAPVL
ncbi:MAG: hypothetical protein H7203_16025 [Rhizobacter sp.]|nr:hypothetical protein [Burkholderiales bacterium]